MATGGDSTCDSQSQYDQIEKKVCRSQVIEHAIKCLTTERDTSVCVQRDHVVNVWKELYKTGEARRYFSGEQRVGIASEIKNWKLLHESRVGIKKPSDLRVCYLAGDNPANDLEVLIENGVLAQNVWAIEKDKDSYEKGKDIVNGNEDLGNVHLLNEDIQSFLINSPEKFDIIFYDVCGPLPSTRQKTLKFIGYVFLYNKLTSPGALITNFSFPHEQPAEMPEQPVAAEQPIQMPEQPLETPLAVEQLVDMPEQPIAAEQSEEMPEQPVAIHQQSKQPVKHRQKQSAVIKERIERSFLSRVYLKPRLLDTPVFQNGSESTLDKNAAILSKMTDEDVYSDYITYQVIDSAYLYIPAFKMLTSSAKGSSKPQPLWERAYAKSSADFLEEVKLYDTQNPSWPLYDTVIKSFLQLIGTTMKQESKNNLLCKIWVNEIYPDWRNSCSLLQKHEDIASMLVTYHLSCSGQFIKKFANEEFQASLEKIKEKCVCGPLGDTIASFYDVPDPDSAIRLVGGLAYGQLAYPSFPVVSKLLRLRYTAKERQMFSDVFIFDQCRYIFDQFPSAHGALTLFTLRPEKRMVLQMALDGMRVQLKAISNKDFWNIAVLHDDSFHNIPRRQKVHADNYTLKRLRTRRSLKELNFLLERYKGIRAASIDELPVLSTQMETLEEELLQEL